MSQILASDSVVKSYGTSLTGMDFLRTLSKTLTGIFSPHWRRARFVNVLLFLGTCCVSSGIAEIGLRVAGYEGDHEREQLTFRGPYPILRKDNWVSRSLADTRPGTIFVRDELVPLAPPPGEQRVLFMGDSGTYGWGQPAFLSYPARFERLARATKDGARLRAINAGEYGFNLCDAYHLYTTRLRALAPRTLVLGFYMANDINTSMLCSPALVEWPGPFGALRGWALDQSALVHFLYLNTLRLNSRFGFLGEIRIGDRHMYLSRIALRDAEGLHFLNYRQGEIAGYRREYSPLMELALANVAEILRRFRDESARDGTEMIVLLIPAPSAVYGQFVAPNEPEVLETLGQRGLAIRPAELDVEKPTRRLLEICDRLGLRCVDPRDQLRALRDAPFRPGDDHPSAAGHAALARALFAGWPEPAERKVRRR